MGINLGDWRGWGRGISYEERENICIIIWRDGREIGGYQPG